LPITTTRKQPAPHDCGLRSRKRIVADAPGTSSSEDLS
jgi:hypothetical protein